MGAIPLVLMSPIRRVCCIICNNPVHYAKEKPYAKKTRTALPLTNRFSLPVRSKGGVCVTSKLPSGVEHAVRGMCEDYSRRKSEIEKGILPPETIGHYMILNAKIDNAIASCCDESFCEEIREDIGSQKGFHHSGVSYLSCGTYKAYKRECKLAIAKALNLI